MTNDHASDVTQLATKLLRAEIDAGLRQFLLSVYNYMGSGLAFTGLVACAATQTGLYAFLVQKPLLFWGVVLAPLTLVFPLSFRIEKTSLGAASPARTLLWARSRFTSTSSTFSSSCCS